MLFTPEVSTLSPSKALRATLPEFQAKDGLPGIEMSTLVVPKATKNNSLLSADILQSSSRYLPVIGFSNAGVGSYGDLVLIHSKHHSSPILDFHLGPCRSSQYKPADQGTPDQFDLEFRAARGSFISFEETKSLREHQTIRVYQNDVFMKLPKDKWYRLVDIVPQRRANYQCRGITGAVC